jgi:hypothetical protein
VWLTSYDPEDVWQPVAIELVTRVRVGDREDLAWGNLSEPIPLGDGLTDHVLVAARHVGDSVWAEPQRWPMHVHLCTTEAEGAPTVLTREEITIARWGLLHQTRERAEADKF